MIKIKLLIILPISTNIDESNKTLEKKNKRILQIKEGLIKFFNNNDLWKNLQTKYDLSIILSDNTVSQLNSEFIFPQYVIQKPFLNNKWGSKNKGAGLIEHWNFLKEYIRNSDYYIHFEPRQLLIDHSFLEKFLENSESYFKWGSKKKNHFFTGLFSCKSSDLLNFIEKYSPKYIVDHKISIEYLIYQYFIDNKIQFKLLNKLGLIWHDTFANRDVEY